MAPNRIILAWKMLVIFKLILQRLGYVINAVKVIIFIVEKMKQVLNKVRIQATCRLPSYTFSVWMKFHICSPCIKSNLAFASLLNSLISKAYASIIIRREGNIIKCNYIYILYTFKIH